MRRATTASALLAGALSLGPLSACGDEEASLGRPAASEYDGPLHLPEGEGRHPRAGAAGDVVDCDSWGSGGAFGGDEYSEGPRPTIREQLSARRTAKGCS